MTDATTTPKLLEGWTTPFAVPPFAETQPADFPPAFDAAFARHTQQIETIATNAEPATFENTVVAMERTGRDLRRVAAMFYNLTGAHTNDDIKAIERDLAPRMAAHYNAITSNAELFARIDTVNTAVQSGDVTLDGEDARLLERTHLGFTRAGAALPDDKKARLGEIKSRLAELGTTFSQNVLADEAAYELPLEAPADLEGLPQFVIDAAASAAEERGSDASHVVTLSRSLIEPFLMFSTRRDLREQAFKAWTLRGANNNANDNREIVAEILKLRQERAELLGYETFAHFKLEDSMAETPERVSDLLMTVWAPAVTRANEETQVLEDAARADGANIELAAWDWRFYAEKVRREKYDLDEAEVKPFFALDNMIDAAFETANRLFGLSFTERTDLDLYHPDVRAWDVTDADGNHVGLFLGDYFARASKRSGAWMSAYRGQRNLDESVRPIIVNVSNFAKAPAGQPTLLSFDDARTLFHEFGHALHGLLSNVTYPSLAGTSVARDFVELPSQLYEHWLETDEILTKYATHHETGAPMPAALREKLTAARNFNQGFATVEYLSSALVDLAFHSDAAALSEDPIAFQARVLKSIDMPSAIVMRHATPHFLHVFAGDGYSCGYYSYMWSEVLDADAFTAFEETGDVFNPALADRLRAFIYGAGGLRKESDAYIAFRGRMPDVTGLLEKRGLADAA
ncbi:MAG: M3 family metallopeptidase [Pseudomonadota bacterium]